MNLMWQVFSEMDGLQLLATVVKAMTYGTSFAVSGGVLFVLIFANKMSQQEDAQIRKLLSRLSVIAIILAVARIAVTVSVLNGELYGMFDMSMVRMVLNSKEGVATAIRCLGLIAIYYLAHAKNSRISVVEMLLASIVTATSFAWVGHTHDLDTASVVLSPILLSVHLVGVAYWIGALLPLYKLARSRSLNLAVLAYDFGVYATLVVPILLIAGSALLWMFYQKNVALFSLAYGQFFLVKLGMVATLLLTAATNKLWLTPRLLKADTTAIPKLASSILFEMFAVSLLLMVTALFTTVTGPFE